MAPDKARGSGQGMLNWFAKIWLDKFYLGLKTSAAINVHIFLWGQLKFNLAIFISVCQPWNDARFSYVDVIVNVVRNVKLKLEWMDKSFFTLALSVSTSQKMRCHIRHTFTTLHCIFWWPHLGYTQRDVELKVSTECFTDLGKLNFQMVVWL